MSGPLIQDIKKITIPDAPGYIEEQADLTVVPGSASVPIELSFEGIHWEGDVGVDIVFLIDHSGSMDQDPPHSDPEKKRFSSILELIDAFEPSRNHLDRIAIILFNGSSASVEQGWETWVNTRPTVQTLMNSSPGGGTPMEDGMRKANQLLINTDGTYKMVILLSDGDPTPDDLNNPQTTNIMFTLVPEAFNNRILYSTIYLYNPEYPEQSPADNSLLTYIADNTDYITTNPQAESPTYYFSIDDTDLIAQRYMELFDSIKDRVVPQDVIVQERINDRLFVDPDSSVSFIGSGIDQTQNILENTPIEDAYELFRTTKNFKIHLNELDGEAMLKFSVKLDLETITEDEYLNSYVEVDVNELKDSFIKYLQPAGMGSTQVTMPIGQQRRIKFVLGINVLKEVSADIDQVELKASNLLNQAVEWLEVAECPSGFIDAYDVEEDFEFSPFKMIFDNRVVPWFFKQIFRTLNIPDTQNLRNEIRNALRDKHKELLKISAELDEYLCQFMFAENPPGRDDFWRTSNQRGIYKLAHNIPALGDKYIRFRIRDASYLVEDKPNQWLISPVDAVEPKYGPSWFTTLSRYTAKGMQYWKQVMPNPDHYQFVTTEHRPDLFTSTCFWKNDILRLRKLFQGETVEGPWSLLDSEDIGFVRYHSEYPFRKIGISIDIHNAGGVGASSQLHVRSYFMPFIKEGLEPPYFVSPPFFATGSSNVELDSHESKSYQINYDKFYFVPEGWSAPQSVENEFLAKIDNAIVINTVDINPAEGEVMLANNKAIEIVPFI